MKFNWILEVNKMFDKGFFGGLFDFNRDGKLDTFERAADFGLFCKIMDDRKKDTEKKNEPKKRQELKELL